MNLHIILFSLISFLTGADSIGSAQKAELLFVGDAMQHQAQLDRARQLAGGKGFDYSDCFTLIAPEIHSADYAVCNLEVPLGGGPDYSGYPCFSAPDSYALALRDAGFDMMLTANNHCLDRRDKAARRTIVALDSLHIDHIGTYRDEAQRDSLIPFIKDINGFRVGFLNYTYGTNGIPPVDGVEVALIDKEKIAKEIAKTRQAGAEILVVAMHWGIEYVLLENGVQRDLADFLVENGVDLIIGGHPHVIQPMKVVRNEKEDKDVLVVYSLGNFISNMKTADTRGGALVKATIIRDADGKARFSHAAYDTFFSAKPYGKRNFTVIPSWMPESIPAAQRQHWLIFERGASRIFDNHNVNVPRVKRD
ncbi:MAG: CapA family protein [Muribaculaceae bacterium]|nr:CapA family protein [Muribaculaceae bacterium]MDE5975104.1 CapA family protein [Muribaculaceae bacterium]